MRFGKIYVINLPDRIAKRDELRLMAQASDIELEMLKDGISPANIRHPEVMPLPMDQSMGLPKQLLPQSRLSMAIHVRS